MVVPNSRIILFDGGPTITDSVYLVYSRDAGHDWHVIDIACNHVQDWAKGVYPAYDGHPALGATVERLVARH